MEAPNVPKSQLEHTYDQAGLGGNLGVIWTSDPVRGTASLKSGAAQLQNDAPVRSGMGPDGDGNFSSPSPGWHGLVDNALPYPSVGSFSAAPNLYQTELLHDDYSNALNTWLAVTGTAASYRTVEGHRNFRGHRPTDLIAGDQGFRTAEGAWVYALRGGVAGMKVSDVCHFMLNQVDDLARLFGRNTELFSDWGEVTMRNDSGKTRMVMRGNATAADTVADKWGFELSVGDAADPQEFVKLVVRDAAGTKPVYTMAMDRTGKVTTTQESSAITLIKGHWGVGVAQDVKWTVGGAAELEAEQKFVIKAPKVYLGNEEDAEPTAHGQKVVDFLKTLVYFLNNQAMFAVISPGLPTKPGAVFACPEVPDDLLSTIVYNA